MKRKGEKEMGKAGRGRRYHPDQHILSSVRGEKPLKDRPKPF